MLFRQPLFDTEGGIRNPVSRSVGRKLLINTAPDWLRVDVTILGTDARVVKSDRLLGRFEHDGRRIRKHLDALIATLAGGTYMDPDTMAEKMVVGHKANAKVSGAAQHAEMRRHRRETGNRAQAQS